MSTAQSEAPKVKHPGDFTLAGPYKPEFVRVDNRRAKRYGAEVTLRFEILDDSDHHQHRARLENTAQKVKDALGLGSVLGESLSPYVSIHGGWEHVMFPDNRPAKQRRALFVSAKFFMPASKPNCIALDADSVLAYLKEQSATPALRITEQLLKVIWEQLNATVDYEAREKRRYAASVIASQMATKATEKAKAATRYEERLKALHEELEREQRAQLSVEIAALIDEKDHEWEDGAKIDPRSIKAAIEHAPKCLRAPGWHPFGGHESAALKLEDVE